MTSMIEIPPENKLTVYYDGACPKCIRDKESYEKLAGSTADQVCWFDITGQDKQLRELGIDPKKALSEFLLASTRS